MKMQFIMDDIYNLQSKSHRKKISNFSGLAAPVLIVSLRGLLEDLGFKT